MVDEEQGSWYECLNRFNRVAQEHADIKPQSDAIVAAIEKLYQYKTINYAKKQRIIIDFSYSSVETQRHLLFGL